MVYGNVVISVLICGEVFRGSVIDWVYSKMREDVVGLWVVGKIEVLSVMERRWVFLIF